MREPHSGDVVHRESGFFFDEDSSGGAAKVTRQALIDMLHQHLALTTQEATARLQGRWQEEVTSFDRVTAQALSMADALAAGIIQQYPQRF